MILFQGTFGERIEELSQAYDRACARGRDVSVGSTTTGKAVVAVAAAGSLIVFFGDEVHGHGANATAAPRRSLQGAFASLTPAARWD